MRSELDFKKKKKNIYMKILSSGGHSLWFPWIEIILSSSSQSSDSNFVFPWNASLLMNTYL